MIKRTVFSVIVLALIFSLAIPNVAPVNAAAPSSYTSTFQVINLESSKTTINVKFLDGTGSVVHTISTDILANDSLTFTVAKESISGGFNGSVVIESTGRIASASNLHGLDGSGNAISYASYMAFSGGSTNAYLPLLMKNNYQFNSFVTVQNLGSAATDVTVNYSDGTSATKSSLAPGASYKFDQALETHTLAVFSGRITSSGQPIGAIVVEVGPSTLFAYSSFSAGDTKLVAPLVNENNYGYFSSVNIQNLGDVETTVEMTYTPSMAGTACKEVRKISPQSSTTFAQHAFTTSKDPATFVSSTCTEGATFVGTGMVTSNSTNVPLAAIVNQLNSAAKKGAAYDAFSSTAGTAKVVFPLIMDRNYNYFTSWSIANLGTGTLATGAIQCAVKGKDINGTLVEMVLSNPSPIDPGAGWTLNHQNIIANRFVGGAICTAPNGSEIVGSVNELQNSTIDSFLVYEGYNAE